MQFQSLQYALFVTCFVEIIGGVFFLITSIYILSDKKKVEEAISGECYQFIHSFETLINISTDFS